MVLFIGTVCIMLYGRWLASGAPDCVTASSRVRMFTSYSRSRVSSVIEFNSRRQIKRALLRRMVGDLLQSAIIHDTSRYYTTVRTRSKA